MIAIQHEEFALPARKFPFIVRRIAVRIGLEGGATIRLAGSDEVRVLNRTYRGKDAATDVLSFPHGEKLPGGLYAGDVLVCVPVAGEQAKQHGHSLARELLLLTIHGLLHLKGLDHETDKGEMLALQESLFAEFAAELP
jgi:probable rRNA maturation factor